MRKMVAPIALALLAVLAFYACEIPGASGTTGDDNGGHISGSPKITRQPRDTSVTQEGTATFAVEASDALTYRWVKNSQDTVGMLATLTLVQVQLSDSGKYKCVVRNTAGSVASNTVSLHVTAPVVPHDTSLKYDLSITSLNQSSRKIITSETDYHCDAGTVYSEVYTDTTLYSISGGKLSEWNPGECIAQVYSGASSTVIGTWTATPGYVPGSVPTADRPAVCLDDNQPDSLAMTIFRKTTATQTISSTKIHMEYSGEICYAEELASALIQGLGGSVTQKNCSSATMINSSSQTGTFTGGIQNGILSLVFKYGSKTCSGSTPFNPPGVQPDCSKDVGFSDGKFFDCIDSSGFYPAGASVTAKKSARQISHLRFKKTFP